MGFIVTGSPLILLRSLKCGLKIGVDGKSYSLSQLGYELIAQSLTSFSFGICRFLAFGGAVPYRPVEDLGFSVARFYQRGGTFQNYYMVILSVDLMCKFFVMITIVSL